MIRKPGQRLRPSQEDQVFRIYSDVNVYEKHDENKNTDKASPGY